MKETTVFLVCLIALPATAQMVRSDAIGNDPAKERLCIQRSANGARPTPFEIDAGYLARARKKHPDVTFFAYGRGGGAFLVECELREETGRFKWVSQTGSAWYWRSLEPVLIDIQTDPGRTIAIKTCSDAATTRATRLHVNFHHNVYIKFDRVRTAVKRPPHSVRPRWVEAGDEIAGIKAEEDDGVVDGKAFYGPADPDYREVTFECLLSLDLTRLKAIKFGQITRNTTQ
ncbi:MAG TPA: hypothetical protein VMU05_00745 [Dongiaceae bacterium]|nr:hypothetical protein [Dongiaceae bacterium]